MPNAIEWTQKAIRQLSKIDTRYRKAIRDKVGQLSDFQIKRRTTQTYP